MTPRQRIGLCTLLVLGLAASVLAVRIAEHHQHGGALGVELGRARLARLDAETIERLATLAEPVLVTYYTSSSDRMPSRMRHLERSVTDLLEAMHARAPERFDFQVVDPERGPGLARFAARRGVAPFRVRSVTRDAWDETSVWSTLAISYGARPEVFVSVIGPEDLPRLQAILTAWLDRLERPRAPVIALAAPPGFAELGAALAARGTLVEVRLDRGEPVPAADLLVWMAPGRVDPERLRELDRFLARGGSVIVAGARHTVDAHALVEVDGRPALSFAASDSAGIGELLAHFGLRPRPGLFLDARHDSLELGGQLRAAPFLVRCIAPNQDFHGFQTQPNGTLLFAAPSPLTPDDAVLRAAGWRAEVLATTSDTTWMLAAPVAPAALSFADMTAGAGTAVAKQPLIVALSHDDPRHGRLIASGATTPFEDGLFGRPGTAHGRLLDTLLDELVSDDRLVVAGARFELPPPLPALGWKQRVLWRAICVFALPTVLLLVGWRRVIFGMGSSTEGRSLGSFRRFARFAGAVVVVLVLVRLAAGLDARVDATAEGWNRLAPETRAIARRSAELGSARVELLFAERSALPPPLRLRVDRVHDLLDDLRGAGAALEVVATRPVDLEPGRHERLAELGVHPFQLSTQDGDVTTVRRFHATAILTRGDRREILHFPDERAFEDLEFRVAFALWRLNEGRRPHVAFASDVPRLSAAEAYEHFQQKNLFAPKGKDVYSAARETLARTGFRVTHVNPRDPELPEDIDLLIWMQPRRSIGAMLEATVRHLVGGGSVLLAAQHFNVQSRQYRGADFELVHWPQPQTPDLEHLYFPELSIELVREVLFDELSLALDTDTQVSGVGAVRDFERQVSAAPFLIRASALNFAPDSPVTRNLGDQAFVWANHLRWDPEQLDELGIEARPLITTSARTWTFAWSGGWLPPEVLAGPPRDADGRAVTLGELPLAALFEGTFPRPTGPLRMGLAAAEEEPAGPGPAWPASAPGRLLFLGCSELFKDHRLFDPSFRGDHLLGNAACALALEPELAAIAGRRRVAGGLDYVPPPTRLAWRAVCLLAGPLAILAAAGCLALLRRRSVLAGEGRA